VEFQAYVVRCDHCGHDYPAAAGRCPDCSGLPNNRMQPPRPAGNAPGESGTKRDALFRGPGEGEGG
jgi:predicted ATP-dependent serine protease